MITRCGISGESVSETVHRPCILSPLWGISWAIIRLKVEGLTLGDSKKANKGYAIPSCTTCFVVYVPDGYIQWIVFVVSGCH